MEHAKTNFDLRIIKFGIGAEIRNALKIYCDSSRRQVYWPVAFRRFCIYLLREGEELVKSQYTAHGKDYPDADIGRIILELQKVGDSIPEWVREKMNDCLSLAKDQLVTQKDFFSALLIREDADNKDWPGDIRSKADLLGSWTAMTVRDDVRQYIWNLLDQIVPGKCCRVCYLGNLMSSRGSSKILIEVTLEDLEKVKKRFLEVSNELRSKVQRSLVPDDVIEVNGVDAIAGISFHEEAFFTSGSPWKEGTLGAILKR